MRPEADEQDRFKSRTTNQKAAPVSAKSTPKPHPKSAKQPFLLIALVCVLVCVSGALTWGFMQQEQQISQLDRDLKDAIGFVSQSKLLIARIEGELSETGEELEQSGSAAARKLAFLDSEMRKLWGISNDRNKKAIAANTLGREALQAKLNRQEKKLDDVGKSLDAFESSFGRIDASIRAIETKVSLASGEMAITRESISEDLDVLRGEVAGIRALQLEIKDNKKAIAAIDSSRKQVNERLVRLSEQMNQLQLQSKPGP
jgi:chromosome segregation ATPase